MSAWEVAIGAALGLMATEFTEVSPWLARRVVRWSARRWAADKDVAAAYAEEWTAVVNDRPGKLLKLFTALAFAGGGIVRAVPRHLSKRRRRIKKWGSPARQASVPELVTVISMVAAGIGLLVSLFSWATAVGPQEIVVYLNGVLLVSAVRILWRRLSRESR